MLLEFTDVAEAEALLRGVVAFKFSGAEESDMYVGSPPFAKAVRNLFAGVVKAHEENGNASRAESWRRTYDIGRNGPVFTFVAHYAARHPGWEALPPAQRQDWLETVASPYLADETAVTRLADAVDAERRHQGD
jgi:hypothetical protein